jgi:hypothetical protein
VDAASGLIVDVHHRQRALDERRSAGTKVADYRDVRAFADDEERVAFVLGANLFRRHLEQGAAGRGRGQAPGTGLVAAPDRRPGWVLGGNRARRPLRGCRECFTSAFMR